MQIGVKIKMVREKLGMTQEELAKKMNCHKSLISKVECCNKQITRELLKDFKEAFDSPNMPITEAEVYEFANELRSWRVMIANGQIDIAKSLREKLKSAVEYCCESELETLYQIFDIYFLYCVDTIEEVKGGIDALAEKSSSFTTEQAYYYEFITGAYYSRVKQNKQALKCLLQAEVFGKDLNIDLSPLWLNIANAFTRLNCTVKSILYIEKINSLSREKHSDLLIDIDINNIQALNCLANGEYMQALLLLQKCLSSIESMGVKHNLLTVIHHNLAMAYAGVNNYPTAFSHFDQEEKLCDPLDTGLLANIFLYKARIFFQLGNKEKGETCIKKGLKIKIDRREDKDNDIVTVQLRATLFEHKLKNADSIKYITEVAIPLLKENGRYLEAIRYCDILHNYFESRQKYKQADNYAHMAYHFYRIITKGDVFDE